MHAHIDTIFFFTLHLLHLHLHPHPRFHPASSPQSEHRGSVTPGTEREDSPGEEGTIVPCDSTIGASSSGASAARSKGHRSKHRWSKASQTHSFSKIYSYVFERCRNCDTYIYLSGFKCDKVRVKQLGYGKVLLYSKKKSTTRKLTKYKFLLNLLHLDTVDFIASHRTSAVVVGEVVAAVTVV